MASLNEFCYYAPPQDLKHPPLLKLGVSTVVPSRECLLPPSNFGGKTLNLHAKMISDEKSGMKGCFLKNWQNLLMLGAAAPLQEKSKITCLLGNTSYLRPKIKETIELTEMYQT